MQPSSAEDVDSYCDICLSLLQSFRLAPDQIVVWQAHGNNTFNCASVYVPGDGFKSCRICQIDPLD